MKKLKLVIGISLLTSMSASSFALNNMNIAVGQYLSSTQTDVSKPLLAFSQNMLDWSYISTLPSDFFKDGILNSASCSGDMCIAVGEYQNKSTEEVWRRKPLLLLSSDHGTNWSSYYKLPYDYINNGGYLSASCFNGTCVAGGSYDSQNGTRPLLISSKDNGATWTYAYHLYNQNAVGSIHSTSCTDNFCMATGSYHANSLEMPLLAITQNSGTNWTTISVKPEHFHSGYFYSADCRNNTCIAAGGYHATQNHSFPYLISSQDKGQSWHLPSSVKAGLPEDYAGFGTFFSTSCNDQFCIAAGGYLNADAKMKPLIAISRDQGLTWVYHPKLPEDFANVGFSEDTACMDNMCFAVGYYENTSYTTVPLMAVIQNQNPVLNFISILPFDFSKNGIMHHIKCTDDKCTVSGNYISTQNELLKPLLAVATDHSPSWLFPSSILTMLPNDFKIGGFGNDVTSDLQKPRQTKFLKMNNH